MDEVYFKQIRNNNFSRCKQRICIYTLRLAYTNTILVRDTPKTRKKEVIKIHEVRKQIIIRLDLDDIKNLDDKAEKAGMSRQGFVEGLIHGVLNLNCKPSDYSPFKNAFISCEKEK